MSASNGLSAAQLNALIAKRHPMERKEWALFFELRDGTGFAGGGSYIDAFALNLWPSRRFYRVAYEVKVSRSDFMRELDQPHKRGWAMDISHEFWFVAPPNTIRPDEVPESCGLLVATGGAGALRRMKAAQQREPRDLTMAETAAVARKSLPSEYVNGLRWKYQGAEIDDAKLAEILVSERPRLEQRAAEEEAHKEAERLTHDIRASLKAHAAALREAGCEPPAFMEGKRDWGFEWAAEQWVAKNVSPGPAGYQAQTVRLNIVEAQRHLERAMETLPPEKGA